MDRTSNSGEKTRNKQGNARYIYGKRDYFSILSEMDTLALLDFSESKDFSEKDQNYWFLGYEFLGHFAVENTSWQYALYPH